MADLQGPFFLKNFFSCQTKQNYLNNSFQEKFGKLLKCTCQIEEPIITWITTRGFLVAKHPGPWILIAQTSHDFGCTRRSLLSVCT